MKEKHIVLRTTREATRDVFLGPLLQPRGVESIPAGLSVEVEEIDRGKILALTRNADVLAVAPSFPMRLITPFEDQAIARPAVGEIAWGVKAVGADTSPFTGDGVVVAVLDTGIDGSHPAFSGVNIVQKDFTGEGNGDQHSLIRCIRVKPYRILMAGLVVYNVKIDVGLIIQSYFQTVIHADAIVQALLYCMLFLSSFISAPILAILSNKIGKARAFIVALVICVIGFAAVTFAWAPWDPFNLLYFALIGFDNTTTQVINSMLADVCDYDTLHSGAKREAQFQSMTIVMDGFARILPNSIPLAILYFLGYDPDQTAQNEKVVLGLKGMMGLYNCVPLIIAGFFLFFFPLDVKKHRKILVGIAAHKRGEAAIDPLTNRLVHPATNRLVSEEHGWFLDQWFKPELRLLLFVAGRKLKKFSPPKKPETLISDAEIARDRQPATRGGMVLALLVILQFFFCLFMLCLMLGIAYGLFCLGPLFIIFVSIPVAIASMFFGFGICNLIRFFYVFRLTSMLRKGKISLSIIENHVQGTRTIAPIGGGQPIVIPSTPSKSKAKQRKLAVASPNSNIDTQPILSGEITPNSPN